MISIGSPDARRAPIRIAHVATIDLSLRVLLLPQLLRLRDDGYDVTTISAPGPWVAYVRERGIRHIPWANATRAWDPAGASCDEASIGQRAPGERDRPREVRPGSGGAAPPWRLAARARDPGRCPCGGERGPARCG